jgi:hypothetical protein
MVDKSHKTCEADRWFAQYGNALLLQEAMWKEGKFDAAKVRSLLTRTPAVVKKVNQVRPCLACGVIRQNF